MCVCRWRKFMGEFVWVFCSLSVCVNVFHSLFSLVFFSECVCCACVLVWFIFPSSFWNVKFCLNKLVKVSLSFLVSFLIISKINVYLLTYEKKYLLFILLFNITILITDTQAVLRILQLYDFRKWHPPVFIANKGIFTRGRSSQMPPLLQVVRRSCEVPAGVGGKRPSRTARPL